MPWFEILDALWRLPLAKGEVEHVCACSISNTEDQWNALRKREREHARRGVADVWLLLVDQLDGRGRVRRSRFKGRGDVAEITEFLGDPVRVVVENSMVPRGETQRIVSAAKARRGAARPPSVTAAAPVAVSVSSLRRLILSCPSIPFHIVRSFPGASAPTTSNRATHGCSPIPRDYASQLASCGRPRRRRRRSKSR